MQIIIFPTYKEIFDKDNYPENLESILFAVPKGEILGICSFISASLFITEKDFNIQNSLLSNLLSKVPLPIQSVIYDSINEIKENTPSVIFTNQSILKIISYAVTKKDEKPRRILDVDHMKILQAFLYENQVYSDRMKRLIEDTNESNSDQRLLEFILTNQVAQIELIAPNKDFISQSYKSYYFFEFIKNHNLFEKHYSFFLEYYEIENPYKYIAFIWNVIVQMNLNDGKVDIRNTKNILNFGTDDEEKKFTDKFSINVTNLIYKNRIDYLDLDFKEIRNRPFYKINNNTYAILNFKFIIDKLFQGLKFDFYYLMKLNGYEKKQKDYLSIIGKEFTEQFLFHSLMNYILSNYNVLKQQSELIVKENKDYSDLYIISANKIYLFECKDVLMAAEKKYSFDINSVFANVKDKFVSAAGVKQFLNIFDQIQVGGFEFHKIDIKELSDFTIYPIIVFTDITYSSEGVNEFIQNELYHSLLSKQYNFRIQRVVLIHMDTLINFQDYFHNKNLNLFNIIDGYIEIIHNNQKLKDIFPNEEYLTFDLYCQYIFDKKNRGYKKPKIISDIHSKLYGKTK